MTYEEICKYLKDKNYREISIEEDISRKYISDDNKVIVYVERNREWITQNDEELIKKRLRELGYI